MKRLFLLAAALLLLSACGGVPAAAPEDASASSQSGPEVSQPAPEEILCRELRERGIADYDNGELKPYDGNMNGCISETDDRREWDRSELLMYKIDGEAEGYYEIVAISEDLEYFFTMSHVDGIFYDIRDAAAYIHDGEHTREEARQELERYLRAETDIDPGEYDWTVWAHWIDGAYNYRIALDEKGAVPGPDHAYEFYVSKDLRRIARVDYRQEPGERQQYMGDILLTDTPQQEPYTAEEVKALLLEWLRRYSLPQAEEGDIITEQDGVTGPPSLRGLYWYRVPLGEDSAYRFTISADLFYASQSLVTPREELYPKAYYTYVKDEA